MCVYFSGCCCGRYSVISSRFFSSKNGISICFSVCFLKPCFVVDVWWDGFSVLCGSVYDQQRSQFGCYWVGGKIVGFVWIFFRDFVNKCVDDSDWNSIVNWIWFSNFVFRFSFKFYLTIEWKEIAQVWSGLNRCFQPFRTYFHIIYSRRFAWRSFGWVSNSVVQLM